MTDNATLRKIKALLAKENAQGTTALAMAARLMEREGITKAALELSGVASEPEEQAKAFESPLNENTGKQLATWRIHLGQVITKAFSCATYRSGNELFIVGRPSDADTVRYLFAYCEREIERLAQLHTPGEGRTYANNFRMGCVDAIYLAIRRERESERAAHRAAAGSNSNALIVVNNAIAKMEMKFIEAEIAMYKAVPNLRNSTGSSYRKNASGRNAGLQAGKNIYPGANTGAKRVGSGNKKLEGGQ